MQLNLNSYRSKIIQLVQGIPRWRMWRSSPTGNAEIISIGSSSNGERFSLWWAGSERLRKDSLVNGISVRSYVMAPSWYPITVSNIPCTSWISKIKLYRGFSNRKNSRGFEFGKIEMKKSGFVFYGTKYMRKYYCYNLNRKMSKVFCPKNPRPWVAA